MAAAYGGPLAFWAGGARAPSSTPTQAAPRGLLAFWAGGAVAGIAPTGADAAPRSLLAPWMGGASVGLAPTGASASPRSLFAFWAGGAARGAAPVVEEPFAVRSDAPRRKPDYDEFFDIALALVMSGALDS